MEEHYKYFPNTPIINPVSGPHGVDDQRVGQYAYEKYGQTKGAGIFMDCWGDYGLFSEDWNHMEDSYPFWLDEMHSGGE